MSELRLGQRSFGSVLGIGVALGVAACVSGEVTGNGDDGGSAGLSTAARAGQGVGGTAAVGGTLGSGGTTGGAGGATGGTTGGVGGAGAFSGAGGALTTGGTGGDVTGGSAGLGTGGAVVTGGSAGVSGSGGELTGGASGTGATGGSGNTCVDTPPPNGDTCANAVAFGWCGQPWMNGACAQSCNMCMGGGSGGTGGTGAGGTGTGGTGGSMGGTGGGSMGGTGGTGGGGNIAPPPNINGGQQAWASRYWDCCKPACGWKGNVRTGNAMTSCNQQNQDLSSYDTKNACESGGSAYMCWDGAPWQVGDNLSYGFVAASGPNYVCGRCFHLQFNGTGHSGNNAGAQALSGKHMIVQVINNGGVAQDQFDLLIPGGGVGLLNACNTQWGTSDLGAQYGGFLTGCNGDQSCVRNKCMTIFGDKPDLMAGCEWFLGWYKAADNPNVTYERIACPAGLTQRSGLSDPG